MAKRKWMKPEKRNWKQTRKLRQQKQTNQAYKQTNENQTKPKQKQQKPTQRTKIKRNIKQKLNKNRKLENLKTPDDGNLHKGEI